MTIRFYAVRGVIVQVQGVVSATPISETKRTRARPGLRAQIMLGMTAVTLVAIVVSHMLHRKAMATHMDHLRTHIAERLNVHHAEMGKQLAAHCTDVKEHGPVVPPPATGHRRGERM